MDTAAQPAASAAVRESLVQAQAPDAKFAGAPPPDPVVAQLVADVRAFAGKVQAQQGTIQAQRQAERDAGARQRKVRAGGEFQREIDIFRGDKPHFDEVRSIMSVLMLGGLAANLAEAYDMATNANQSTRERIRQAQRTEEEWKRRAEAEAKAEQARKAATVNVRSSAPGAQLPKTVDDSLQEIARRR